MFYKLLLTERQRAALVKLIETANDKAKTPNPDENVRAISSINPNTICPVPTIFRFTFVGEANGKINCEPRASYPSEDFPTKEDCFKAMKATMMEDFTECMDMMEFTGSNINISDTEIEFTLTSPEAAILHRYVIHEVGID